MTQPLIALSGRRYAAPQVPSLPDNFRDEKVDIHISAYSTSIISAGGIPILLPCDPIAVEVLSRVDALVLTGGADVDPSLYGETAHPTVYGIDPLRDRVEISLVHAALDRGLPVLAVCRGMQVLNVALGGSLIQHLERDEGEHHAAWDLAVVDRVHPLSCTAGSLAAQCFGSDVRVNSLHHQAVGRLGHGLVATATAPDGVVEAAELPGHPLLAVQWHPELLAEQPDPSMVWLVEQARLRAAGS